jgi:hypothetical protein
VPHEPISDSATTQADSPPIEPGIFAIDKNIHGTAKLALFIKHTVARARTFTGDIRGVPSAISQSGFPDDFESASKILITIEIGKRARDLRFRWRGDRFRKST